MFYCHSPELQQHNTYLNTVPCKPHNKQTQVQYGEYNNIGKKESNLMPSDFLTGNFFVHTLFNTELFFVHIYRYIELKHYVYLFITHILSVYVCVL